MNSDVIAIVLFVVICWCIHVLHSNSLLEVTQCPGMVITRSDSLRSLEDTGYLEIDLEYCATTTMTVNDFNTIRRLQRESQR